MKYSTVVFVLIAIAAIESAAQTKTVSNADLEKYRQARLTSEREYRENHVRLGLPSPDELARRNEVSRKEMIELSAKLREEELEREKIALEANAQHRSVVVTDAGRGAAYQGYGIAPAYIWGYSGSGRNGRWRGGYRVPYQQPYVVRGGSIWPIVPTTNPRAPIVRIRPRN